MKGLRVVAGLMWLCAWACGACWTTAVAAQTQAPVPESFVLDNGMQVVLEEDHSRPRVGFALRFDVGSFDDPPGHDGLAHLTEHMMFEGWGPRPGTDYHSWLSALGVTEYNAYTGGQATMYHALVPSPELPRLLWSESQRWQFLLATLDEERFESGRTVAAHEESMHGHDSLCRADRQALANLMHGRPVDYRDSSEIDDNSLANVQWFFQRWYRPERARLVLVGDFDTASVRALLKQYFEPIRQPGPREGRVVPKPPPSRPHVVRIRSAAEMERLMVAWLLPALPEDDLAALTVLAYELSDRLQARFGAHAPSAAGVEVEVIDESARSGIVVELALRRGERAAEAQLEIEHQLRLLAISDVASIRLVRLQQLARLHHVALQDHFRQRAVYAARRGETLAARAERLGKVTARALMRVAERLDEGRLRLVVQTLSDPDAPRACAVTYE